MLRKALCSRAWLCGNRANEVCCSFLDEGCRAQLEEIEPLSKMCLLPGNEQADRGAYCISVTQSYFVRFAVAKNDTTRPLDYRRGLMRREEREGISAWLMHLTQTGFRNLSSD